MVLAVAAALQMKWRCATALLCQSRCRSKRNIHCFDSDRKSRRVADVAENFKGRAQRCSDAVPRPYAMEYPGTQSVASKMAITSARGEGEFAVMGNLLFVLSGATGFCLDRLLLIYQ